MKKKKTTRFLALALSALLLPVVPFSASAEDGILGDVNADGVVDASDASLILGFAALCGCGTPADPADYGIDPDIADINGDGELDARDTTMILILSAEAGVA